MLGVGLRADPCCEVSRTPLIRALLIGCLATVSTGCGDVTSLAGGKLSAAELSAVLDHRNPDVGPYTCSASNSGWTATNVLPSPVFISAMSPSWRTIPPII